MKCLVTGGVGLIGSHLCKSLLQDSNQVIVADRRALDESIILKNVHNIEHVLVDLRDTEQTAKLIAAIKPDVIYHLAGQPLSALSNIDPLGTVQDNIVATYAVLEGIRNNSPRSRLVYTSSACFYGVPNLAPPLTESDGPAIGHYVYTATKIAADFGVRHYKHIYGLNCATVRMVNVYGPGEMHFERIVPRLVIQALNKEKPSLTQSDGSDVLAFLYVDDVTKALRLIGEHPDALNSDVWNIGALRPTSILELMERIYRLVGISEYSFVAIGPRQGKPVHKYLDGTLINEKLAFSPSVDLDKGLSLTIEWYRQYLNIINPSRQEENYVRI